MSSPSCRAIQSSTCGTSEKLTLFGDNTDFSLEETLFFNICNASRTACSHGLHRVSSVFPQFLFSSLCLWVLPLPSNVGIGKRSHLLALWCLVSTWRTEGNHARISAPWKLLGSFSWINKKENTVILPNRIYQKASNRDRILVPYKKCTFVFHVY